MHLKALNFKVQVRKSLEEREISSRDSSIPIHDVIYSFIQRQSIHLLFD